MEKIGFIGLGNQGAPMARRIVDAGYPLMLWARKPETLEPFEGSGAKFASSITELASYADHVGVCVVNDEGVKDIVSRLIPAMREGSRIVIHSTAHPNLCVSLAEQADERGIDLIDAPVSGGGPGAASGTLTVMVGGEANVVAAALPIFNTFAAQVVHLGDVGAGQTAKLVNNALMAANVAVAHYALEVGESLAIDRKALIELIKNSSGRSFGVEVCSRMATPSTFKHGAALLAKDVRLLGESINNNANFSSLRDTAMPFLNLALDQTQ